MRKILLALALLLIPAPALATTVGPFYGSLVVPTGGSISQASGGTGCVVATLGTYSIGNCPQGTASFGAGANITITGSNPYTIACPNCFQTTGGTVSGATTFSGTTTFSALPTSSVGFTNSSTSAPIISGASGSYSAGVKIGNGAGTYSQISTTASTLCSGTVAGTGLALTVGSTLTTTFDSSGNLCTIGTIYYTSARADKYDIQPASIDGLGAIDGADFNLAWKYRWPYGDPHQVHYGPMADSLPAYIAGPHHDRIDLQALVVTEGVAIQQLDTQVRLLWLGLLGAIVWLAVLTGVVLRGKNR